MDYYQYKIKIESYYNEKHRNNYYGLTKDIFDKTNWGNKE